MLDFSFLNDYLLSLILPLLQCQPSIPLKEKKKKKGLHLDFLIFTVVPFSMGS